MKLLFGLRSLLGIFILSVCRHFAGGQYFEDVNRHFVTMPLDLQHRGSFNISDCTRELLNCWETIKPDLTCTHAIVWESVCGLLRSECSDADLWMSPDLAPIHEGFCDRLT